MRTIWRNSAYIAIVSPYKNIRPCSASTYKAKIIPMGSKER